MRHIWSLIAGVVIAPLAWFLIAFGQGAMSRSQSLADYKNDYILGGLLIVGVGLLLGLIGSLRTSPVGALFAAVAFLGVWMFALFAPLDALNLFGDARKLGSYEINLASPLNTGTLGLVGGMLLMAAFSPARWRGRTLAGDAGEWMPPPPPDPWEPPPTPAVSSTTEAGSDKAS